MVVGAAARGVEAVVIGGGPGGYLAAIRLAQAGRDVLLVEARPRLGGVCLNEGCIPSKALIHAAGVAAGARAAAAMGIRLGPPEVDVARLVAWKEGIVARLTGGVARLVEGAGGELLQGRARFTGPRALAVETAAGVEEVTFQHAVVATGSAPVALPGLEPDGELVVGSREALSPPSLPPRLLLVGAGYVGLELGLAYRMLGCEVDIVEVAGALLPALDPEVGRFLARRLRALGVRLHLESRVVALRRGVPGAARVAGPEGERWIDCDRVVVCAGRRPATDGLGLEAAGLAPAESGHLAVDAQMRTAVPHILAVGDVTPGPPLAHRAYRQAEVAAAVIAGEPAAFDSAAVPAVVYTDPEVAAVGLTEREARARGLRVVTGRADLRASGRALTLDAAEGFVKVVAEAEGGRLLGVQIVAPAAGELIAEATLALEMCAFLDDVGETIHPHPTLSEALQEACLDALGRPIHRLARPRR